LVQRGEGPCAALEDSVAREVIVANALSVRLGTLVVAATGVSLYLSETSMRTDHHVPTATTAIPPKALTGLGMP